MRGLRGLLVVLILLAVVAAVADEGARRLAQDRVAEEVQASQSLPERPDVHIGGFPFLTQLAAGHFAGVEVTSTVVPTDRVELDSVRARLHDVRFDSRLLMSGSRGDIEVGSVDVAAVLSYTELTRLVAGQLGDAVSDVGLGYAGDHRMTVSGTVLGLPVELPMQVVSSGDRIVISVPGDAQATAPALVRPVLAALSVRVTVPELPYGVRVSGVTPAPDGLLVEATGSDLRLS